MLQKGDRAPDIELQDQDGVSVRLSELWKESVLVLFFYPKDRTFGCTKEACAFRDSYEDFRDDGAEVVGVSSDGAGSHQRFRKAHSLPFRLLSDEHEEARKAFGLGKSLGIMPARVTFVIDQEGKVCSTLNSQFQFRKHFRIALRTVRELKGQGR